MSEPAELLTLIERAIEEVPSAVPSWLEPLVANASFDEERLTHIDDRVNEYVPYFSAYRLETERELWQACINWIARTLRAWSSDEDPTSGSLAVALTLAGRFGDELWSELARADAIAQQVAGRLDRFLSTRSLKIASNERTSFSEQAFLDRLKRAEVEDDWSTLASDWSHVYDLEVPTIDRQALRLLAVTDPPLLAARMDATHSYTTLHLWMHALSAQRALDTALLASEARVQFAALLRTVDGDRSPLDTDVNASLTTLLAATTANPSAWPRLMDAFNRYPVRSPTLQEPIGAALAVAPSRAVVEYVDSLDLSGSSVVSRAQATTCMTRFHTDAPLEQRLIMWERAFERWTEWGFNGEALLDVACSVLDYAVVGWLVEGDGEPATLEPFEDEFASLDDAWFDSINEMRTAYNSILSRMQPYAHVIGGVDAGYAWDSTQVRGLVGPYYDYLRARFGRW